MSRIVFDFFPARFEVREYCNTHQLLEQVWYLADAGYGNRTAAQLSLKQ